MAKNKKIGYYNVCFPRENVDVGQRYFFFSTLFDTPEGAQLGGAAQNIITSGLGQMQNIKDSEGRTIIVQALDFLAKTIEFERQQEIDYFNERILNNNNLTDEMRRQFADLITADGSFDYTKFLALINVFYQGVDSFQSNLSYEMERLEDFNKYLQEFKGQLRTHKNLRRKYKIDRNLSDSSKLYSAFKDYLDADGTKQRLHLTDNQVKKLLNTQTLTNRISTSLENIYNEVWNSIDWQSTLGELFFKNGKPTIPVTTELKKTCSLVLFTQFISRSQAMILQLLQNNQPQTKGLSDDIIKDITTKFADSIEAIDLSRPDQQDMYPLLSQLVDRLKSNNVIDAIYRLYDRTFKQIGEIKSTKKDAEHSHAIISGFTKETIVFLEKWLNEHKKEGYQVGETENWTKRKYAIINELSKHFNISLKDANNQYTDYTQITDKINIILQTDFNPEIKSNVSNSSYFSEELAGMLISLASNIGFDAGLHNLAAKADTTMFEIAKVTIPKGLNFDKIAKQLIDEYIKTFNSRDLQIIYEGEMIFDEKELREKRHTRGIEYSIEAETERRMAEMASFSEQLKTELQNMGLSADEIKNVLKELTNSFAVDSTVKSYNMLDNEKGFKGGSVGGSLEQQIRNIKYMFDVGGIDFPDMNWLLFSIYNCGAGEIGGSTGAKESIEDLFSTVAVMLLFEDSGEQARFITEQASQRLTQAHRFLHLYNLNGTFFTQSYVLQLTYNGLARAYGLLQTTEHQVSNGSRANIINPVNVSNMVTRTPTDKKNKKGKTIYKASSIHKVSSTQDWFDTFKSNKNSVSIQITFLAGFLDILEEINRRMVELVP